MSQEFFLTENIKKFIFMIATTFFSKKYAVNKWTYPGVNLEEHSGKQAVSVLLFTTDVLNFSLS